MQNIFSKLTAGMLAACISLSMGVYASAAPNDYSIRVTDTNQVQLVQNGGVATYSASVSDLTVKLEASSGALLLRFPSGDSVTLLRLGVQSELVISGNLNSLTLDSSLTKGLTVSVTGKIAGDLTVDAPVAVSIGAGASVGNLKVANTSASVKVESGAAVTNAYAANAASISGVSSVQKLTATATGTVKAPTTTSSTSSNGVKLNMKGAPAPKQTKLTTTGTAVTTPLSGSGSIKTTTTATPVTARPSAITNAGAAASTVTNNQSGKIKTFLEVNDREDKERNYGGVTKVTEYVQGSKNISWLGDYEVEIEAKSGSNLGRCMQDMVLTIKRADNDTRVGGSWKWISGSSSTNTSGTYQYQFTPTSSNYPTTTVTVHFKSNGSRTLEKPKLNFASGQRSHGDAGEYVSISVGIPDQVIDDDELLIYVDNKLQDTYELSDGDAGERQEFSVEISSNYEKGDKVKIKVKVEKGTGSGSTTSKTITYEIDDD